MVNKKSGRTKPYRTSYGCESDLWCKGTAVYRVLPDDIICCAEHGIKKLKCTSLYEAIRFGIMERLPPMFCPQKHFLIEDVLSEGEDDGVATTDH